MDTVNLNTMDGTFKAVDHGDYYSMLINGAWTYIPKAHADAPKAYLAAALFRV